MADIKVVNAADFKFRNDNRSGPKYLCRGPNVDVGMMRLGPGEDMKTHYHNEVEEIFLTTRGECDIWVDGIKYSVKEGDLLQVPPKAKHYLKNPGPEIWEATFIKSPYLPKDKVDVEWMP